MSDQNSNDDALQALQAMGLNMANLSDEQRQVLSGLSPDELNTLRGIKQRLDAAGGDVQGYGLGGAKGR
jgi:hypothetical protein